jgi:hypothetical protein
LGWSYGREVEDFGQEYAKEKREREKVPFPGWEQARL